MEGGDLRSGRLEMWANDALKGIFDKDMNWLFTDLDLAVLSASTEHHHDFIYNSHRSYTP